MVFQEIFEKYIWVLQVFCVVALTLVAAVIVNKLLRHFLHKASLSDNILDDILIEALTGPTKWMVWLLGICFAGYIVGEKTQSPIFDAVGSVRDLGIIVLITWFSIRFSKSYESRYISYKAAKKQSVDVTLVSLFGKLFRASVIITSGLVVLQTMGINIAGLLAFGGVGGIAVGMAARDMIANFFGGLTVYLDQPFKVGDWIRSSEKEIEGTVEDIGWRRTVIRTFDKRPLYIPNAVFTTITVENPSRMTHRRLYETIGVRYEDVDVLPIILGKIKDLLNQSSDIDSDQTLMVNMNEFGPSSVDFFIYAHTHTTDWKLFHEIKEKMLLQISEIITSHKAEIAFPTTTIQLSAMENEKINELAVSSKTS